MIDYRFEPQDQVANGKPGEFGRGRVPAGRDPRANAAGLDLNRTIINQHLDDGQEANDRPLIPIQVIAKPTRCHSRLCPVCGPKLGYETRAVLTEKLHLFQNPAMISLTIDQNGTKTGKGFDSKFKSWEYVTKGGFISRLMRALKIINWVWVVEFQQNDWPHWHILVDMPRPCDYTEFNKHAWSLWRYKWQIGGYDLSADNKFDCPEHAVNYITKYMTKAGGFPEWFLKMQKVRVVQGSRSVGRLVMNDKYEGSQSLAQEKRDRETQPVYKRIAECGHSTDLILMIQEPGDERACYQYLGKVSAPLNKIIEDTQQKIKGITPHVATCEGAFGPYEQWSFECEVTGEIMADLVVPKLNGFYEQTEYLEDRYGLIREREQRLLADYDEVAESMRTEDENMRGELARTLIERFCSS